MAPSTLAAIKNEAHIPYYAYFDAALNTDRYGLYHVLVSANDGKETSDKEITYMIVDEWGVIPPSPTHTSTFTPIPTSTATWTPSSTPTFTSIPTQTETQTAAPTPIPTTTPTQTASPTSTPTASTTPTIIIIPTKPPKNHPPVIMVYPEEPYMWKQGTLVYLSAAVTDEDGDSLTISFSPNAPITILGSAYIPSFAFMDLELDTDRLGTRRFTMYADDGSERSQKEISYFIFVSPTQAPPTPAPSPSRTKTWTPQASPTHIPTATPTRTLSPTSTNTPTVTPAPSLTWTPMIHPTITAAPTRTLAASFTPTPSNTPAWTLVPTTSPTPTRTISVPTFAFPTQIPTWAPVKPSFTMSPTLTYTTTAASTATLTPTPTLTITQTRTLTPATAPSSTATQTFTPTTVSTVTPTRIPTSTRTPTKSPSCTPTIMLENLLVLRKIPDLRILLDQPSTVLLNLDEYVHSDYTQKDLLSWEVETHSDGPVLTIDSSRILWAQEPKRVGSFPITIHVSDGKRARSQQALIKVSHFIFRSFYLSPPVILNSSEQYQSENSLYDFIIPNTFPREQIAWIVPTPLPKGIAAMRVMPGGQIEIHSTENPPLHPIQLPIIAVYRSPTPTAAFNRATPTPTKTPTPTPLPVSTIVLSPCGEQIAFSPYRIEAVGPGPLDVVSSDINQDGQPDFLTANYDSNSATLLMSGANGEYTRSDWIGGEGCLNVIMKDLTGDAKDDLILLGAIDSVLTIHQGAGQGNFTQTHQITLPVEAPLPGIQGYHAPLKLIAAGRLLTGLNQLLAVSGYDRILFYHFYESGRSRLLFEWLVDFTPLRLEAADINADGIDELIVTHAAPNGVSIFTLHNRQLHLLYTMNLDDIIAGNTPLGLSLMDLNADTITDIIVPSFDGTVRTFFGATDWIQSQILQNRLPMTVTGITAGDFNQNGNTEIMLTGLDINAEHSVLTLYCGNNPGAYTGLTTIPLSIPYSLDQHLTVLSEWVNDDRYPDVILTDRHLDRLIIYLNDSQ